MGTEFSFFFNKSPTGHIFNKKKLVSVTEKQVICYTKNLFNYQDSIPFIRKFLSFSFATERMRFPFSSKKKKGKAELKLSFGNGISVITN